MIFLDFFLYVLCIVYTIFYLYFYITRIKFIIIFFFILVMIKATFQGSAVK